jgi:EmrB/QacA subfamily drug resistance transporter
MIGLGRAPCDEAVIRAAAETPGGGGGERARPWVLVATILGSSLVFIDGSVVNVALPAIQADLGMAVEGAQWVVTSYLLMLGALLLVGGAAGDRFGRRRVFALGAILFTAFSVVCGVAPSASILIGGRALQGVGAALLVPGSLAIISAAYPARQRSRAIGIWAGFSAITTALGPVLGGWLVDAVSWRAIFFINVPLALLTLGATLAGVPESRDPQKDGAVDWKGGLLATLGLGALAFGLTSASSAGWANPTVLAALLAGILGLALFLWVEARAPSPLVTLSLFRSPTFSAANALTLLLYFAFTGVVFLLPFDLIRLHGYSATEAGAAFLPSTLIMGGLSPWSGGLVDRFGARLPLTIGPALAAIGIALLAVPGIGASYATTFLPAMIVLGLGMAVSVAPLTTTVMGAVEPEHAGTASGINNAVSRVAGMLAVAILGTVAVGVFGNALDTRLATLDAAPEIRRALDAEVPKFADATVPRAIQGTERQALDTALEESLVESFRIVMLVAAALALMSALCARWIRR